jgi:nitronate monooxygenase
MYDEGDLDAGVISCGQGVGLMHDIPSMQELFDRMMGEAEGVVNRFATA